VFIRVIRRPRSCRVYVAGLRLHHGATGCAAAAVGLLSGRRRLFALGCLLIAHDWRDRPWRLLDP
jgi:hypothetical protein